jgi:hypothetical protein
MSKTQSPWRLYKLSDSVSRIIAIFIADHRPTWELTLVADMFILIVERLNYGINAILARQSGVQHNLLGGPGICGGSGNPRPPSRTASIRP